MIKSKRKPNLFESDRGKEFCNSIFQDFLNRKYVKIYSKKTSLGAVFAKLFERTNRELLKQAAFKRGDANWIDVLPTITKQYINRVHTSTKLTPIQASFKKNEGFVYNNSLDKRKRIEPKFEVKDLVRTADLKKTFSKSDLTNRSFKLYKLTEIFDDTIYFLVSKFYVSDMV